jgi:hypothetical protein
VAEGQIRGLGTTGSVVGLTATSCQQDAVAGGGLLILPGSYGVAVRYTNCNPLLVAVGALQTFSNAELTVSSGAMQYTAFTSAPSLPIGGTSGLNAWCWRGSFVYQNGVFPHACAEADTYGTGCNTVGGSTYQEFTDSSVPSAAGAAAAAMNGRAISFVPSGSSYILLPSTAAFVAPSGTATALPAVDDGEATVPLTVPFVYPGGFTTQLYVHSNGFVSVGSNATLPNGAPSWVPQIPAMLEATETAFWSWHDYNPAEVGSGSIVWEEIGTTMYITWNGVESYPTTAANPSTFQFQIDEVTGQVTIVWQTIDGTGGSGFLEGDDHLIGFSPGGVSPDTGGFDLATLTSIVLSFPEDFPLSLNTSAKPIIGTTISLDTSNENGISLGLCFVGTIQIPAPGFDLAILGAPGCPAFIDVGTAIGNVIGNLPSFSMSVPFALPNNPAFAGLSLYAQSIWLEPAANPFGATVSNGLDLLLGNF